MKNMVIGILLVCLASCDFFTKTICGEQIEEVKILMDSINRANKGRFFGEPVSCYPGYYKINLKTEVDSIFLDKVEKVLEKNGFTEVLVYDKRNELVRGNTGSM